MSDDDARRVKWSERLRMWTVRVRTSVGRKHIPLPDARSEAEARQHAPIVAAAARNAVPDPSKPSRTQGAKSAATDHIQRAAPKPGSVTVLEHARAWIKTQSYTTASEHADDIERFIASSPIANVRLDALDVPKGRDFVRWLKSRTSKFDGKPIAPRTVINRFDVADRAVENARCERMIGTNPLRDEDVRRELPDIRDKIHGQRARRKWARKHVVALLTDARVPHLRRVTYGLLFVGGGPRSGMVCALRVRDYDPDARPLARLTYSVSIERKSRTEKPTKTNVIHEVPVHPVLRAMLDEWLASGFREAFGRDPMPDDFMVPTFAGRGRHRPSTTPVLTSQRQNHINAMMGADCETLGIMPPPLKVQACRRTFVSLCRDDGATRDAIHRITHPRDPSKSRDAFDAYDTPDWSRQCREVEKLQLPFDDKPDPGGRGGRNGTRPRTPIWPTRPGVQGRDVTRQLVEAPGVEPGSASARIRRLRNLVSLQFHPVKRRLTGPRRGYRLCVFSAARSASPQSNPLNDTLTVTPGQPAGGRREAT